MKIYGGGGSPFVQRVLMAARLKGHDLACEPPPGGDMKSPEFRALSPLGRIPLLDDDGWTLPESRAIVDYLDAVLDGPPLYPADPKARAKVALIESLADGELAGLRAVMVGQVFGMPIAEGIVAAGRDQIAAGLAAIAQSRAADDDYAASDVPSAADCVLAPLLTLIEIIDPFAGLLALVVAQPGLAAYRARIEDHPVIARSSAEMRTAFAAILARRRGQA